jgi:adenylate cyclase
MSLFTGVDPIRGNTAMPFRAMKHVSPSERKNRMAQETERKFLVKDDTWRAGNPSGLFYRQGYLSRAKEQVVRVRSAGGKGFLTVKGITRGISRAEYEYEIPVEDANHMLEDLCERPLIEKRRYEVPFEGMTWEVDEFLGGNLGLVLAEIELSDEGQEVILPPWVGEEVSGDPRYYNAYLVKHPFCGREKQKGGRD